MEPKSWNICPAELNFKIPTRTKFPSSQSLVEPKYLNYRPSAKNKLSSPTKSKTSTLKPRWKTIQFPPIPQRVVLKPENSPASYLRTWQLTRPQLRIIPQKIGIQPKLLKTLQQNKLSPHRVISQQIEDSQSLATIIKFLGTPQAGFSSSTQHYSYNGISIMSQRSPMSSGKSWRILAFQQKLSKFW